MTNMSALQGALSDPLAQRQRLDVIGQARDRAATTAATLGTSVAAIGPEMARDESAAIDTKAALSRTEDVGQSEPILELRTSQAAYAAALYVATRVLDNSLLDFLR